MATTNQDKEKRNGIIGTIVFHVALLVCFIFFGLTSIYPPEEMGVMVDFGYSDQGMGNVESKVQPTVEQEEEVPQPVQTPAEPVKATEEVVTQETEETITIPEKQEEKKEEKKEVKIEKKPSPSNELMKAMEQANNAKASEAGSDGEKPGVGNMGQPNGKPDGDRNGGSGDGPIGYSLNGRNWRKKPTIADNSQFEGKVVVQIVVDRYGNVTRATGGAVGSTTTNAHLTKIAEEAALQAKFTANPNAAEEQVGTITILFKLK